MKLFLLNLNRSWVDEIVTSETRRWIDKIILAYLEFGLMAVI